MSEVYRATQHSRNRNGVLFALGRQTPNIAEKQSFFSHPLAFTKGSLDDPPIITIPSSEQLKLEWIQLCWRTVTNVTSVHWQMYSLSNQRHAIDCIYSSAGVPADVSVKRIFTLGRQTPNIVDKQVILQSSRACHQRNASWLHHHINPHVVATKAGLQFCWGMITLFLHERSLQLYSSNQRHAIDCTSSSCVPEEVSVKRLFTWTLIATLFNYKLWELSKQLHHIWCNLRSFLSNIGKVHLWFIGSAWDGGIQHRKLHSMMFCTSVKVITDTFGWLKSEPNNVCPCSFEMLLSDGW